MNTNQYSSFNQSGSFNTSGQYAQTGSFNNGTMGMMQPQQNMTPNMMTNNSFPSQMNSSNNLFANAGSFGNGGMAQQPQYAAAPSAYSAGSFNQMSTMPQPTPAVGASGTTGVKLSSDSGKQTTAQNDAFASLKIF